MIIQYAFTGCMVAPGYRFDNQRKSVATDPVHDH